MAQCFVVVVDFVVRPESAAAFSRAMVENARASRTLEEGCLQFDVCQPANDPTRFFLYEIYRDESAFREHLASAHFRTFDAEVTPWLVDKQVRTFDRIAP